MATKTPEIPGLFDDLPEAPDQEQIARITLRNWRDHVRETRKVELLVKDLLDKAVDDASKLGRRVTKDQIGQVFEKNPTMRNMLSKVMRELADDMVATIEQGSKDAWLRSEANANQMVAKIAAGNPTLEKILKAEANKPQNDRSLVSFQNREVNGMNLSKRVWRLVGNAQRDMEQAIEVALSDGTPADELSRKVRQLLQEPNRLFRRRKGADGKFRLSKAAAAYHPGAGVYRSSYKNAMRLARTEVNMAYQTADNARWEKSWWVKGIRIQLSNNHTIADSTGKLVPLFDICDMLAGDYPADFKFIGWHPQCRCFATAITCSYADIRDYYQRKRAGEDMTGYAPPGAITEPPASFKNWMKDNSDRLAGAAKRGTTPYFISENAKYTNPNYKPAKDTVEPPKKTIKERAKERHAARTAKEAESIQEAWSRRQLNQLYDQYYNKNIPWETYEKLQSLIANRDFAGFAASVATAKQAALRHAKRSAADIETIRKQWNASRIEKAGETTKVAAVRDAIEKRKITSMADAERILHVFYDQFPEEFNNVKVRFIEFNKPPQGGNFTMGYSKHDKEIAFNSNAGHHKESPAATLIKTLEKIRTGKKLSLDQHRSAIVVVHELLHQKTAKYVSLKPHNAGDYKRTAMESMNELAARATYTRFLRRVGANTEGADAMIRNGNGYQDWVKRLLAFIDKAGQSPTEVGKNFAATLTTKAYDTMDAELYGFFKAHAKKNFTQDMDKVLSAFESGSGWNAMLNKWFD